MFSRIENSNPYCKKCWSQLWSTLVKFVAERISVFLPGIWRAQSSWILQRYSHEFLWLLHGTPRCEMFSHTENLNWELHRNDELRRFLSWLLFVASLIEQYCLPLEPSASTIYQLWIKVTSCLKAPHEVIRRLLLLAAGFLRLCSAKRKNSDYDASDSDFAS